MEDYLEGKKNQYDRQKNKIIRGIIAKQKRKF